MRLEGEQTLLRVHLRNTDRHGWFSGSAVEALVSRAKSRGLAGATVWRGFLGLDVKGQLLETRAWSLVDHVPVIVEIVDSARAIGKFLTDVAEIVLEGFAALERAHVLLYRHRAGEASMPLEVPAAISPLSTLPTAEEFPIMRSGED